MSLLTLNKKSPSAERERERGGRGGERGGEGERERQTDRHGGNNQCNSSVTAQQFTETVSLCFSKYPA
jgi:hypothetical protein